MSKISKLSIQIFALLLLCAPAYAAPFCVQTQSVPPQCDYVDAVECRKRAAELMGLCVANPVELHLTRGSGQFCLVDSNRISQCIYNDRTSCYQDAQRTNSVCIENIKENIQPNPYVLDPNRKY